MPRRQVLPDELGPEVKEFAGQLRRLVERSGLGIGALADRTGYSETSWVRYLNGRLLAPKGAVVAFAEVTGTDPVHLTTLWELAERAWSRSEMRHDMTMEAIRISQARAALGECGGPTAQSGGGSASGGASGGANGGGSGHGRSGGRSGGGGGGRHGSVTASWAAGLAGPAADSPAVPAQASGASGAYGGEFGPAAPWGGSGGGGRRRLPMALAAVVGAALVGLGAYALTSGGGDKKENAGPSAPPTTSAPELPAGVQCVGAGCTGKDPEAMGCGGDLADSPARTVVGTVTVEVRYSATCKAAWARIQGAAPGDSVQLKAGAAASKKGVVGDADTDAYTPMVAVNSASEAKACATLGSGQNGCTE